MSEPEQHKRLVGLRFIESVPFAGDEITTAMLRSHDVRGKCDSISPVRFEPDGREVGLEKGQAAQGFALERSYLAPGASKSVTERVVVGMPGIRVFIYGPAEVKPDAK